MDEEQEDQLRGAVALFVGRLEMQELLAALAALDQAGFNVPTLPCPAL
jgi:heme A synthase